MYLRRPSSEWLWEFIRLFLAFLVLDMIVQISILIVGGRR